MSRLIFNSFYLCGIVTQFSKKEPKALFTYQRCYNKQLKPLQLLSYSKLSLSFVFYNHFTHFTSFPPIVIWFGFKSFSYLIMITIYLVALWCCLSVAAPVTTLTRMYFSVLHTEWLYWYNKCSVITWQIRPHNQHSSRIHFCGYDYHKM